MHNKRSLPLFWAVTFLTAHVFGAEPIRPLRDTLDGPGWRFFAEAPIRFRPVVDQDRTYVGSDDGYCIVSITKATSCGSSPAARQTGKC